LQSRSVNHGRVKKLRLVGPLVALLVSQGSCKHAPGVSEEQSRSANSVAVDDLAQAGTLTVSLRALLISEKSERPVLENEVLHAGDHLYFVLRTSQPAYLYVVLFGPDGVASVLFPGSDQPSARVAAQCPIRLPAQGSFYLQSPSGLQDLRVVASAEPLAVADRRLCEQLRLPCESVQAEPIPSCKAERSRALFSAVKVAAANTQGVAALRMQLKQEP
jgi:hypothetical protein